MKIYSDALASCPDWRIVPWLETLLEEASLCSLPGVAREEKKVSS